MCSTEAEVDTADTRAKRLHVTDRGGAVAAQAIAAVETADAGFFRPIADPAALLAMLRPLTGRSGAENGDSQGRR